MLIFFGTMQSRLSIYCEKKLTSVLFADDELLFYFPSHASQAKRVTEIHLWFNIVSVKARHGTQPRARSIHLSSQQYMSQHTTDALIVELKGSTSSMPKPVSGHDPEPVPPICYLHSLCSDIELILW